MVDWTTSLGDKSAFIKSLSGLSFACRLPFLEQTTSDMSAQGLVNTIKQTAGRHIRYINKGIGDAGSTADFRML